MAKSLEEMLKDLRTGGYSEGSIRNWLVNKGFPSAKVDKAMALRTAKDAAFKPGDHVVIQAGYGGKGGQAGQDFKRFSSDTPAVVTDIAGGDVYVRPEGSNYKWKVQAKALVEGTTKALAHDADRRSRLHRALDAVMDSCGARARDAASYAKQTLTLNNDLDDQLNGYVLKAYEDYKKMDTARLKDIYKRSHKVSDLNGVPKRDLIADILEGEFGRKRVTAAFAKKK